jgi:predicted metal-dependent HD superfamily phosphohydrolase
MPLTVPPAIGAELLALYREPHRAYHNDTHIAELLGWFDIVAEAPGAGWRAPRDVVAAMLFHDAIYTPGAKDNEARSAALARAHAASLGVDAAHVAQLIELTARHGALDASELPDADAAHFLDCDTAILGADPAAFDRYDAAIRSEYGFVPDAAYRTGRRGFLAGMLARPRIFFSALFHTRLDAIARANLARAIARLDA